MQMEPALTFKVTEPSPENLHKANIQIQFAAYFI